MVPPSRLPLLALHLPHHLDATNSSDLHAALYLLFSHTLAALGRVAGLFSNGHKLMCHNRFEDDKVFERIRIGAKVLVVAYAELQGEREWEDAV